MNLNPMSMEGRRIIVTGAASGIGRETAILITKLGGTVFLLDINKEGLEKTIEACGKQKASYAICDITDENSLQEVIQQNVSDEGKIHGFVHCAGVSSLVPLKVLSTNEFERVQKINTEAGVFLAKICSGRRIIDSDKQCSFVFISSVYGVVGSACNISYAASKAAILGITKALSVELANKNIRVNCVAPGFISTNMAEATESKFDLNYKDKIEAMHLLGWGKAEDVANAIVFLLSDASKWITGTVLNVDGGFTAQ